MSRTQLKDARPCLCGSAPIWSKSRGRAILACPSLSCRIHLAISGPTIAKVVEDWNKAVDYYGSSGKRN